MTKQQEETRLRQVNCRLIGESCTCNPEVLELPCFGCVKVYVESVDLSVGGKSVGDHIKDLYDQREQEAKLDRTTWHEKALHRISSMVRFFRLHHQARATRNIRKTSARPPDSPPHQKT